VGAGHGADCQAEGNGRRMSEDDPFDDISKLRVSPELLGTVQASAPATPTKIRKRQEHFIKLPMAWYDRLTECSEKTYKTAIHVLYLDWKNDHKAFKLANGMLQYDGVSRWTKSRALTSLVRLGLVTVEQEPRKSPIVHVHLVPKDL
jgi:hypothetical protein